MEKVSTCEWKARNKADVLTASSLLFMILPAVIHRVVTGVAKIRGSRPTNQKWWRRANLRRFDALIKGKAEAGDRTACGHIQAGKKPFDLTWRDGREHGGCAQPSQQTRRSLSAGRRIAPCSSSPNLPRGITGNWAPCCGHCLSHGARRRDARSVCRLRELLQRSVGRVSLRAGSSAASPHLAGGGWVNDSEPEAEFQATVNKSKAMLKTVALAGGDICT